MVVASGVVMGRTGSVIVTVSHRDIGLITIMAIKIILTGELGSLFIAIHRPF
jgi:hypothetical protein